MLEMIDILRKLAFESCRTILMVDIEISFDKFEHEISRSFGATKCTIGSSSKTLAFYLDKSKRHS